MIITFLLITLGAVLIMWDSSRPSSHKASASHDRGSTFVDDDEYFDDDTGELEDNPSLGLSKDLGVVHYDLKWLQSSWNPFDLKTNGDEDSTWQMPNMPWTPSQQTLQNGYLMHHDVSNRLLVFVSEGDLYVTQYDRKTIDFPMPAARVTTTVGNVRYPRLHPTLPVVAYTATYEGVREVYLQDLRTTAAPTRLTFWDHSYGVSRVVGWQDETTLLIAAQHTSVALPDFRLFQLYLAQGSMDGKAKSFTAQQHAVMEITPVPLSQAQDAATQSFENETGETVTCFYFTRNSQSSHTLRYVGGTVEQLWAYCDGQDHAVPLTTDYVGTSKMPSRWYSAKSKTFYLFFLSDRVASDRAEDEGPATPGKLKIDGPWTPGTMNLWAMPLPTLQELYSQEGFSTPTPFEITNFACWQQSRTVQEYRVDDAKRNVVLRMGADLFEISYHEIETFLSSGGSPEPTQIGIQVLSDFHETQERLIPFDLMQHFEGADVISLPTGQISVLLTLRGQTWLSPVLHDTSLTVNYQGGGQNMPPRRYRVAPGSLNGGSMRVLVSLNVPIYGDEENVTDTRLALVLATDPLSPTAEHAFYLLPAQESATSAFADLQHAPLPFLGGHVNGGSTRDGGLGSILKDTVSVSPCGRRLAWGDTDGRLVVMTLPLFDKQDGSGQTYTVLPDTNELGEPMDGSLVDIDWSPGGRYLAITHTARNKFSVISIADCGDPLQGEIQLGRIVQATPSRFNSMSPYWGFSRVDQELDKYDALLAEATGQPPKQDVSTTLYFLTDRDIHNDVSSPWGTRAPMPHYLRKTLLYALPLLPKGSNGSLNSNIPLGRFSGGAAMEIFAGEMESLTKKIKSLLDTQVKDSKRQLDETSRRLASAMIQRGLTADSLLFQRVLSKGSLEDNPPYRPTSDFSFPSSFPADMDVDFGPVDLTFARRAYRMVHVPESNYYSILSQTEDNGSLVLVDASYSYIPSIKIFSADSFPNDDFKERTLATPSKRIISYGTSTDRKFIYIALIPDGTIKVVKNTVEDLGAVIREFSEGEITTHVADLDGMALSVWPKLEYVQLYNDAWRMLRDYFYDSEMHQVDWPAIHERYVQLVDRCAKREELDDVLAQMAAELSALHVFVYGGDYNAPFDGNLDVQALHKAASLGATLKRSAEWKGYMITEIPHRDPDFNLVGGNTIYSPLSSQALWQTGQKGLEVGDVIVGINGESVFRVPDINMLLRGMSGRSVRLEVLRLKSGSIDTDQSSEQAIPQPVIVVPLSQIDSANLRYNAWEYQTRTRAKLLASEAGFTVGYVHMRAMGSSDVNAFAQGFFEDYDKEALILDVRHNHGGNIDSWVTTMLQRAAWSYFGGRNARFGGGDLDWNQQGSFQGHVVVLVDEHTSSDGEGVARSISELGLGRLVGTRTWGGGIWLASDNTLVDGGIATAPEFGVYNDKFGWGLGIEQQGVTPDVIVDNEPHSAFLGKDMQLERAIAELKDWLQSEPIIIPKAPARKPDMSLSNLSCQSTP